MSEVERTGRTVEEAVEAALAALGAARDEVEVEVMADPAAGGTPLPEARVFVRLKDGGPAGELDDDEDQEPADYQEILEMAREDALDFVEGLLDVMDVEGEVAAEVAEEGIFVSVDGEEAGLLIGRRGQTMEAIQEILRSVVQRQARTRVRVTLDIEGYRERRRQALEEQARQMAERAQQEGEVELEPMPAFERKIVHDTVGQIEGVTSFSEGEEPNRRVIIARQED